MITQFTFVLLITQGDFSVLQVGFSTDSWSKDQKIKDCFPATSLCPRWIETPNRKT